MKISKFRVRNFKGVSDTEIGLADLVPGNIVTLIGLNESGKTTLLEAISLFSSRDKEIAFLTGRATASISYHDFIPKDKEAAFSDNISISAEMIIEDSDVSALLEEFRLRNVALDISKIPKRVVVETRMTYEDSRLINQTNIWGISFSGKIGKSRNTRRWTGAETESEESKSLWHVGVACLQGLMPSVLYFPTFVFDFPDRIYLEPSRRDERLYFKKIIQDVLDSQGAGLDIERHILQRINNLRSALTDPNAFINYYISSNERRQIESVCQIISGEISRIVFGSWNEILNRRAQGQSVSVNLSFDTENKNAIFLEISIVDGQSKFTLRERSLGFRWFFSFLLFTQFRKNRRGQESTVFLFDEPASNLHAKAQLQLMESFSKIARERTFIIYSTHSHYMVNPAWLNKAYIIANSGVNYDRELDWDVDVNKKTNIKALSYRNFVASHLNQTSYFQPVLDSLDVRFSPLLQQSNALIIEGKNDYFPLLFFFRNSGRQCPSLFPANGADNVKRLVSLFRGWGVRFRILLDSDVAGVKSKKKHMNECNLLQSEIFTLADIDETMLGKSFESMYMNDIQNAVKKYIGTKEITKSHYSLYFQHLLSNNEAPEFPETSMLIAKIIDWAVIKD